MKRFVVGFLALALVACGGSDGGGSGGSGGSAGGSGGNVGGGGGHAEEVGQTYSQPITAAQGGTLATPSGSASLAVPAGALAADVELTVTVAAAAGGTASPVYDFGPEGTTFQTPATLSLQFDAPVPEGKKAVLGLEVDGAWQEVPGSSASGNVVTGSVSHFSHYAIILVDGQAVLTSDCANVVHDFQPCGGDVVGTWHFVDLCFDATAIGTDPTNGQCPGAHADIDLDLDGTVEFTADGQSTTTFNGQTVTTSIEVPASCLPAGKQCSDIADDAMCAQSGANCECTKVESKPAEAPKTQAYRIEGNTLIFKNDDGSDDDPKEYCVQGNRAVVHEHKEDTDGPKDLYYVVEK
jgi:hypothetical protein